ncbi:MAG: HAD-IIA family hydrolase [Chloroflexi bacterium]|nr:HAD-IIA family hydrolase [Chloroflexota bacterium]
MSALADAGAVAFDVDGTLVLSADPNTGGGVRALPGAAEVLEWLRAHGKPFVCFTNGTGQTPRGLAAKLRAAGLPVSDDQALTPASVAAEHIRATYPGEAVLAFGNEGLLQPLRDAGVAMADLNDAERVRVVLIGADPDFTYVKLTAACKAVWAGAPLLVTSMAPYFASSGGRLPSTSGAIAAGIHHVTGVEPIVVGKPSPLVLHACAALLDTTPGNLVVVGDDVRLEIRMAREAGARAIMVLTGSSSEADVAATPEHLRPEVVVGSVRDLI